jgi:hypothetical protein
MTDAPLIFRRRFAAPQALGIYRCHKHIIAHHFCKVCSTAPWSQVTLPDGTTKIAINLRSSDLSALPTTEFDGAAL